MKILYLIVPVILSACASVPTINNKFAYDIYQYRNLNESDIKIFAKHLNDVSQVKIESNISYSLLSINQYQDFVEKMENEAVYPHYKYAFEICNLTKDNSLVDATQNKCSYTNLSMTITADKINKNNILFHIKSPKNELDVNMDTTQEYLIYYFKNNESTADLYIINRNWVLRAWDYYHLSPQKYNY